jgi:SAM-dependent methyltransferase
VHAKSDFTSGVHLSNHQVTRGYGLLEGFLARKRASKANALIPSDHRRGRLLDIGCGSFPFFLVNTEFAEKHGLDQVVDAETTRQFAAQGITLAHQDFEHSAALPFADDYFDVVTMLAVFEHIEPAQLGELLGEIRRILKPGGVYVLTTPASWTEWLLETLAFLHLTSPHEIDDHKNMYDHPEVSELLCRAGFSVDNVRLGYFEFRMNVWGVAEK